MDVWDKDNPNLSNGRYETKYMARLGLMVGTFNPYIQEALSTFPENPGSIPSTHKAAHNCL